MKNPLLCEKVGGARSGGYLMVAPTFTIFEEVTHETQIR